MGRRTIIMKKLKWHNEERKVSELVLYEGNPRKMNEKQAKDLMRSLSKFNVVELPVVDQNNRIIAGNMRVTALKTLGRGNEVIEVRVPNRDLTEAEAREYLLRSNKNTGSWDMDELCNFDEDLLLDVGWGSEELDFLFQLNDKQEDDFNIDAAAEREPKFKVERGDLFEISSENLTHRLLCGDAICKEDIERLMGGEKADMVLTDPPYGINIVKVGRGGKTKFGKVGGDKWVNANYYRPIEGDDKEFDPAFLLNLAEKIILFGANYYANRLPKSGGWICWDKKPEGARRNNFADCELCWTNLDFPPRIYRCVWQGLLKEGEQGIKRVHPTQKPVKLLSEILNDFSKKDDIILDLFLGSGSTMVACEQTGRVCYGTEMDANYCSVILERMLNLNSNIEIKKNGEPLQNNH